MRAAMGNKWANRRLLFFVDNDSARDALVKAYSPSLASQNLVYAFFHEEMKEQSYPWLARVPSASNIADLPTRGKLRQAAETGRARIFELTWGSALVASLIREV